MSGQLTLKYRHTSHGLVFYTFRTSQIDVQVWSSTYDVVDLVMALLR